MLTDIRALADHFLMALPNINTLYGVLMTKTKILSNTFALISIGFCFSLSFFRVEHLIIL